MITKLGKIKSAQFGIGGYQDAQAGFTFEVGGDGWGTIVSMGMVWAHLSKEEALADKNIKWAHEDRLKCIGENGWTVIELMKAAKVSSLSKLVGIPVKVFFESENGRNQGFEILKEVL